MLWHYLFFSDMSLLFSIFCRQIIVFKSNKSASDFFEKNYCCSTFILSLKFFIRYQFWLKSDESVLWIFSEKMTEQMNRIRLNMWFYFASFHIRLKLITTKYRMLLKCFILIKCIILLYFLFVFLIFFSNQSD